jgi:hypothetical protein
VLLDEQVDALKDCRQAALIECGSQLVVEHRSADLLGIEESQRLAVTQELVQRFRDGREIQSRAVD